MATSVFKATADHVRALALRPLDVDTCRRIGYQDPTSGVLWSLERSDEAVSLFSGDSVYCVAGVLPISNRPHLAQLWCATSPEAKRHAVPLCRIARRFICRWLRDYDGLVAWVDLEDAGARHWVSWLGFRFMDRIATADGHVFLTGVRGRA